MSERYASTNHASPREQERVLREALELIESTNGRNSRDLLVGVLKAAPGAGHLAPTEHAGDRAIQSPLAAAINQRLLEHLGLKVVPTRGIRHWEELSGRDVLRLEVADRHRLAEFLTALRREHIADSPLASDLPAAGSLLLAQLRDEYHPVTEERALNLIARLAEITRHFERLGFTSIADRLRPYAEAAEGRYLVELLTAERAGILPTQLARDTGISPGDRQLDTRPEFVRVAWTKALNSLGLLRARPEAADLAGVVGEALKQFHLCAETRLEEEIKHRITAGPVELESRARAALLVLRIIGERLRTMS